MIVILIRSESSILDDNFCFWTIFSSWQLQREIYFGKYDNG